MSNVFKVGNHWVIKVGRKWIKRIGGIEIECDPPPGHFEEKAKETTRFEPMFV